jgi:hypothetical protein
VLGGRLRAPTACSHAPRCRAAAARLQKKHCTSPPPPNTPPQAHTCFMYSSAPSLPCSSAFSSASRQSSTARSSACAVSAWRLRSSAGARAAAAAVAVAGSVGSCVSQRLRQSAAASVGLAARKRVVACPCTRPPSFT